MPDGCTLASGSGDTEIKLWCEYSCVGTLAGHSRAIDCLTVLSDGTLCSGSRDTSVSLGDLTRVTSTRPVHRGKTIVPGAPLSGCPVRIIWSQVKLWRQGLCSATLCGHTGFVRCLAALSGGLCVLAIGSGR